MLIDLDTLNELKEIMEDDFDELISVFISDSQTQIKSLQEAINSSNSEDIRRIAHTLKGSSANLGINDLSESCRVLEHKAADNSLEDANELFEKIKTNCETAISALEENFIQ
ncbi:MAG: Hpt domain-containing protein [Gammaproteobacteria bacterium]|nr:Hpt domain-containing protein [Gammaproteobacteria bacterium]